MPCYLYRCTCPLGRLVLASDGAALTGLWFAGQKHFAASLPAGAADAARQLAEAHDTAPALLALPDTAPAAAARRPAGPAQNGPALFRPAPSAGGADPAADALLACSAAGAPCAAAGPAATGAAFPVGAPDGRAPRTGGAAAFAAPDALPAIFRQTEAWLVVYFAGRDPGAPPPLRPAGTPFQRAVWAALCRIPYGQTTSYGALARRLTEAAPAGVAAGNRPAQGAGLIPPDGRRTPAAACSAAPAAPGDADSAGCPVTGQSLPAAPAGDAGSLSPAAAAGPRRPGARAVGSAVGRNPISILIPCHRVLAADGRLTGYAGGLDRKAALLALEGILIR